MPLIRVGQSVSLDRHPLYILRDRQKLGIGLLEGNLHPACSFRPIHPNKGFGNAPANRQKSVVSEDQNIIIGQVSNNTLTLIKVRRNAFIAVIAGVSDDCQGMLGQGQKPIPLRGNASARGRMGVDGANNFRIRHVNRAMNRKPLSLIHI